MRETRSGPIYGCAAYGLWGLFPLYFVLFSRSGHFEVVAHRALWSLALCAVLLTVTRTWPEVCAAIAQPRLAWALATAGLLIVANWSAYVAAVLTGRTLETALGYFINPLAVAAAGIVVLGERLRPLQWVAMVLGLCSVAVMVLGYGQIPWIALILAVSFAAYSLVKKVAGRSVAALPGLAIETGAVAPFAAVYLVWLTAAGGSTAEGSYAILLATTGVITMTPLLLFAAAVRRVRMVTIAMLQYMAPTLQFLLGWLLFGEPMPLPRWIGFGLVWSAVVVFVADALMAARRR